MQRVDLDSKARVWLGDYIPNQSHGPNALGVEEPPIETAAGGSSQSCTWPIVP
ncbi:MAG TPA: hypothetical protein VN812_07450 [Candidatus Acidoferrales bacterium]|nr:hypothetical protein [Candidatus Acidoferrales bacterium]